ncbi:MAG TPA: glycosyltransferase family 39 protein [Acidimicrobiia bacterium]|nr:glycosyltransferase family 39 protein [Acidimicrobiia bacterium]
MSTISPPRVDASPALGASPPAVPAAVRRRPRVERVWRGPDSDPAWVRPALLALLAVTAALYLWNLGASGWANSYYSAAVQAGTQSWKAFFFGSTDAANFVTVDKTPASLWVMEISGRIFGVNAWSVLAPQALEGVAAVGILFATVKRWFSPAAALIAGAVFALTPVAALMFRFNNPDALLVLLLVASAYAMTRALEDGRLRWIVGAGVFVGFGFLAKELQAFLVLPAFGLVYLLAGPPKLARRIRDVLVLGVTTLLAGGWWVAIVQMWPASSRPYIGGSQNNSFWNVLFGYNGFGRLTGNESGSVGGAPTGTGQWGPTGITRMFNAQFGGQISWLLPAALVLLVAGLVFTARRARTDRTRAALALWGGWLVVTGLAFSLGQGIIHEYYSVALAPAIGAIIGIGATTFWARRDHPAARVLLGFVIAATAVWAFVLLNRTPSWVPWLRAGVLIVGLGVAAVVAIGSASRGRLGVALAIAAIGIGVAAPAAYTLSTVKNPHTGAIPTAGPASSAGGRLGRGGGGPRNGPRAFPGGAPPAFAGGNPPPGVGPAPGGGGGGGAGGAGGLLNGSTPGAAITSLFESSTGYRWTAAAVGANNAAGYQLASGKAIMAIGGFNGTDPTPSLAQFEQYVKGGAIHYFIASGGAGGGRGGNGGASTSSAITQWVEQNFTAQTVGGVTIYDLTS